MSKDFTGIRGLSDEKNLDFSAVQEQLGNGDWRMKTRKFKCIQYKIHVYFLVAYTFFLGSEPELDTPNTKQKGSYVSNSSPSGSNNYSQSQSKSLSDEISSPIFLDTRGPDSSDKVWQLNWYLSQANLQRFTSH